MNIPNRLGVVLLSLLLIINAQIQAQLRGRMKMTGWNEEILEKYYLVNFDAIPLPARELTETTDTSPPITHHILKKRPAPNSR